MTVFQNDPFNYKLIASSAGFAEFPFLKKAILEDLFRDSFGGWKKDTIVNISKKTTPQQKMSMFHNFPLDWGCNQMATFTDT
jgi:hypothetical protein